MLFFSISVLMANVLNFCWAYFDETSGDDSILKGTLFLGILGLSLIVYFVVVFFRAIMFWFDWLDVAWYRIFF